MILSMACAMELMFSTLWLWNAHSCFLQQTVCLALKKVESDQMEDLYSGRMICTSSAGSSCQWLFTDSEVKSE
jgi:hypothetical protein